ncbi:DEKNAAC100702 [Brettanomyces naardenensis]|uniref:DEKNAAC100702 n=1 Tax=Brettanomyces naardenensis TaxID=13370 RepID=A0A448YEY9_BRENA|nr:DEKNAAC100702 [Brettanomyces naardenensis]
MMLSGLRKVSLRPATTIRLFHSYQPALVSSKAQRKLASIEKKKKNLAIQTSKNAQKEKVDPVLGRADNPFVRRIQMEIEEPSVLAKGFEYHEVEKLLYGAKDARLLKMESSLGHDEEMIEKVKSEEAEKKEIVMRILSMRNAPNEEKEKKLIELGRKEFQRFDGDTGSSEVQAAVMTVEIYNLMRQIKQHPQDLLHIRRVRMLTQKRQRILRYLKRDDPERYFWCIEKLGVTDENVHVEFNFDRKYSEEFEVWPGRVLVKVTKQENEERRKQRRAAKVALRKAMSQGIEVKELKVQEKAKDETTEEANH